MADAKHALDFEPLRVGGCQIQAVPEPLLAGAVLVDLAQQRLDVHGMTIRKTRTSDNDKRAWLLKQEAVVSPSYPFGGTLSYVDQDSQGRPNQIKGGDDRPGGFRQNIGGGGRLPERRGEALMFEEFDALKLTPAERRRRIIAKHAAKK